MIFSMVVAVTTFSAIADASFSPLEKPFRWLFEKFNPAPEKDLFLYQRIRRIKIVKITELACEITTFIVIGMIGSQVTIYLDEESSLEDGTEWTWMTSFYWAVQTATTIGYGDLSQLESLRYFKIFYLMIATVLVGNALGKLGSLKEELEEARRQHAWDRRPITRRMIDEMQAYDHDDKVDQYEFLVSSLVSLGHIDTEAVKHIMDKFREHAGDKGYIAMDDAIMDENPNAEQSEVANEYEVLENDVIDEELEY
jgi:Ion channel